MALDDHFDSIQFIVEIWNTFLGEVTLAKHLQGFKGSLDKSVGKKICQGLLNTQQPSLAQEAFGGWSFSEVLLYIAAVYFLCSYSFPMTPSFPLVFLCIISPYLKKPKSNTLRRGVNEETEEKQNNSRGSKKLSKMPQQQSWVELGRKTWSDKTTLLMSILPSSSSQIFHEASNFKLILLVGTCSCRTLWLNNLVQLNES